MKKIITILSLMVISLTSGANILDESLVEKCQERAHQAERKSLDKQIEELAVKGALSDDYKVSESLYLEQVRLEGKRCNLIRKNILCYGGSTFEIDQICKYRGL